jgi:putative endonuclease
MTSAELRRARGERGEYLARAHLEGLGYVLLHANWRIPEGEVDLIMQDGEALVFVEVRTRTSDLYGSPEASITPTKKRRLQRTAEAYLQEYDQTDVTWRIDVVAIEIDPDGRVRRLDHYPDAILDQGLG